jgi:hypothetical protein
MSPPLDDTDERIRSTLRNLPVGGDRAATVLPAVRAEARSRRNRRRTAAITGAVVVLGLAGFSVTGGTDDTPVRTASAPEASETTGEYAPLTPLADGPLPVVPKTMLIEHDGVVYSIESRPGELHLSEPGGEEAFDPEATRSLVSGMGVWASEFPDRKIHVLGITRADVARVEWIAPSGTLGAETFALPALPQLRFFFIEDPERTVGMALGGGEVPSLPHVIAYGADGTVLADSQTIEDYEFAHQDEVDARRVEVERRRGGAWEDAGIADVRVELESSLLMVEMYKCEGEPRPRWTQDDTAIRVSATVLRPLAEGPCLSGETAEIGISFGEPVGDRPIIDAMTGEVLVEPGSGL